MYNIWISPQICSEIDCFWLSSGSQGASSNRRRLWAVDQTRKSQIVQLQLRGNIRDDSGWATFALFGNKKLTSACSLTLALWRCVKAIWIFFRVQQAKFICQILFQASFVNFGDSFNLNIYHETTTVSNSQQFKHLFVQQEQQQPGGMSASSQKQLSMDTFLPSKFQHQSNPLESPRTQNGAFSSMSLRQWGPSSTAICVKKIVWVLKHALGAPPEWKYLLHCQNSE